MKDAARIVAYFAATLLLGSILAPPLYWGAHLLAGSNAFSFLGAVDFDSYFHRALLLAAVVLLWPLLKCAGVRSRADLGLQPNHRSGRDLLIGFLTAAIPLLLCGCVLLALNIYVKRFALGPGALAGLVSAGIFVPLIEECFFRGLILGLLLRSGSAIRANAFTSGIFAIIHFLKAPEGSSGPVTWTSGFVSVSHSFTQFAEPALLLAGFATLFLIGWILGDARVRTKSLWLPVGLHSGWIFGNGLFNRLAHRRIIALPWLGRNLLVGIVPLCVCLLTWGLVLFYLRRREAAAAR